MSIKKIATLELCADINNGQSASGIAANQPGSKINVSIGKDVRTFANKKRPIVRSPKKVKHSPYYDRLLC